MIRAVRVVAAAALTLSGLWVGAAQASAASLASLPTCTRQATLIYQPVADNYSSDCVLGYGNQGDGVVALQRALNQCNNQPVGVDGIFGNETKAAIVRIQRAAGITQDGVYGPQTRNHMGFMIYGSGEQYCVY
ncbi:peptidoglycan-binding domain-containing protein [Kitasatospora griseola]|uniref:peptidoglycan-binding domain-containing protein n=1 Tax=Kitasatospora griseola TaxID=2064 RepID=UPI003809B76B